VTDTTGPDLRELASAYALGALSTEEATAFEAFLAANPDVQKELAEDHEVGALLSLGASGPGVPTPPPGLRAAIIARVTATRVAVPKRPVPWLSLAALTALAASLVAIILLNNSQRRLRGDVAARDSTIVRLEDSLTATALHLTEREAELNTILDPGVSLTRLSSTLAPEPAIQLFWNHRTNLALVHAVNLPPAAGKRVYQLWFIPRTGRPIPSVTFNSEASGRALVQKVSVPANVELTAAALTEEPEGGSTQPTTPVILAGSFEPGKS